MAATIATIIISVGSPPGTGIGIGSGLLVSAAVTVEWTVRVVVLLLKEA